jgi:serine/threonine protein kinase/WD40 repeat protein
MWQVGDQVVPGYSLEKFLGRGQFGEVWRATSPGGTVCALKLLNLGGKQGWKEFRSIQRIKRVRHPHLAPFNAIWLLDEQGRVLNEDAVASLGRDQRQARATLAPDDNVEAAPPPATLVVATVLGDKTLGDRMRECQNDGHAGIPVDELLDYMDEAAKGIDFLNRGPHDLGDTSGPMQHCDIKPENILLIGNSALICDFGVSQVLGSDEATTATATSMIGSPAYMPPECILRKPSGASDQYSLALTYYELRTGRLPFDELQIMHVLDAHRNGKLNLSRLSAAEQQVIRKATSVQPANRFESASEMVQALRRAVAEPPQRRPRRRWLPLSVVAVVAVIGATIWIAMQSGNGPPVERPQNGRQTVENGDPPRLPEPQPDIPDVPAESADTYARRALAAVEADDVDAERLAMAVEDYRRAIQLDPTGPYTITPPPFILPPPAGGAGAATPSALQCLAVAEDGLRAVAAGDNGRVWMWQLDDRTEAPVLLAEHPRPVWSVAMKGLTVVSSDMDGTISVVLLDAQRQQVESRASGQNQGGMAEVALSGDGQWLATGGDDGAVRLWRLADPASPLSATDLGTHDEAVSAVVFSPDRRWVVTGGFDNMVRQWPVPPNSDSPAMIGELSGDVTCLIALGDTGRIAFAGEGRLSQDDSAARSGENSVVLARLDGKPLETLQPGLGDMLHSLASDSANRWLASGAVNGAIQIWTLGEGPTPRASIFLLGHSGIVRSMAFCHVPGWLVSASDDSQTGRRVALWRLSHPETPMWLAGHQGRIAAVATTRRWIVAACGDGAVRLWSVGACLLVKQACDEAELVPRPSTDSPLINARRLPSAGPPRFVLAAGR